MTENNNKDSQTVILELHSEEQSKHTLKDVFTAFSRRRLKFLAWLLILLLAGGVFGLVFSLCRNTPKEATSILSLNYSGVEQGLDPAGALLDINTIKSTVVVSPALDSLSWTAQENLTAEDVRQAISIQGRVPDDVLDRLTVIETISSSKAEYYQNILDVSYYPTEFIINLSGKDLGITADQACELLDAILASYRDYFFDTYANARLLAAVIDTESITSYDYAEAVDVLDMQISTMIDYTGALNAEAPDFRSSITGFSFSNILSELNMLKSIDIDVLSSLIYSYNLTKNYDQSIAYYQYRIMLLNNDYTVAQATKNSIDQQLANYEKDSILLLMGDADLNSSSSFTTSSDAYDKLIQQSINATTDAARLATRISFYQQRINHMQAAYAENGINSAAVKPYMEMADQQIATISEKLNQWTDVISQTADDYYNAVAFKNACQILSPAQIRHTSILSLLIMIVAMAVVFVVVGFIVEVIICFFLALRREEPVAKGSHAASQK